MSNQKVLQCLIEGIMAVPLEVSLAALITASHIVRTEFSEGMQIARNLDFWRNTILVTSILDLLRNITTAVFRPRCGTMYIIGAMISFLMFSSIIYALQQINPEIVENAITSIILSINMVIIGIALRVYIEYKREKERYY